MRIKIMAIFAAALLVLGGCGSATGDVNSSGTPGSTPPAGESVATQPVASTTDTSTLFSDRDKEIGYDEATSVAIALNGSSASCESPDVVVNGGTVTITGEGTYILTGEFFGQIIVEAPKTDKVQLVLNGVSISCASSAAIYIKQTDKVFITLATGTSNTLSNSAEFVAIDENNIDAVIFSKEDLTLNGLGSLTINAAFGHGVVSKDSLVFTSGTYTINAAGHAMTGKDEVAIADGSFTIKSGKDGIHAENTDDATLGLIYIGGGTFNIEATDDGIHAAAGVTIDNGTINITQSYEGIEGQSVTIAGGDIALTASDDGVNAAGGNDGSGVTGRPGVAEFSANADSFIKISGGKLTVNAMGDGLDANGALFVSGGESYISGSANSGNGALDYDGEAQITGGILIAVGAGGMAQGFGSTSTQGAILAGTAGMQTTAVTLQDSTGQTLASYTPPKQYSSVVISCPGIEKGQTYTLNMGTDSQSITMSELIYGQSGGMGGGMGGGGRPGGEMGGTPPDGSMGGGKGGPAGERPQGIPQ